MRILAHVHKYPPEHNAGAEMMLHAILRHLAARGHSATVYGARLSGDHQVDGVTVKRRGPDRKIDVLYASADVVVTHLDETRHAITLGRKHGKPIVHLIHNDRQVTANRLNGQNATLLVANSNWIAETLPGWARSVIVYPPVDPPEYRTEPGDHVTLLNLAPAKGGPLFFKLAERLPGVPFLGVKGAYAAQAIPSTIPPNVTIVENTPDVVDEVYARTGILLVPSSYESFGRVAIEAACSGIPVIAHPTAGLRESLGDAGIFIDRGAVGLWAEKIETLRAHPDDAARVGRALQSRAVELAKVTAGQLDEFADELDRIVRVHQAPPGRRVDFLASTTGYFDHLVPVWRAMPVEHRGRFLVTRWVAEWARDRRAFDANELTVVADEGRIGPGPLTVVSSSTDQMRALDREVVMMEHGAGQSYGNAHQSYAGGVGRKNVVAFLMPGPQPSQRNAKRYRRVPHFEIGCPKLDEWLRSEQEFGPPISDERTVALSFGWGRKIRAGWYGTALDHYRAAIPQLRDDLAEQGIRLIGHSHGRARADVEPICERAGIPYLVDFADVVDQAQVYVCDNSSTIFEFAALGRPVVLLNAPSFRRDVELGLRFWTEADVGENVEGPAQLLGAVLRAVRELDGGSTALVPARSRQAAVGRVYAVTDGTSSRRASEAIVSILNGGDFSTPLGTGGLKVKRKGRRHRGPLGLYPNPNGRGQVRLTEEGARERGLLPPLSAEQPVADVESEERRKAQHKKREAPDPGEGRRPKTKGPDSAPAGEEHRTVDLGYGGDPCGDDIDGGDPTAEVTAPELSTLDPDELERTHKRAHLDEIARSHGIDPKPMRNKREVVDAILAATD